MQHSDNDCQDTAFAFGVHLPAARLVASMGNIDDCFGSAAIERFFATLKIERLYRTI